MPGKRRSRSQLERDRRRIADLYLRGRLQVDIAQELGISQQTVSLELKALHREWLASALIDVDRAKAKELAKVDRLEQEYWTAWERSCEDAETVTEKGKGASGKDKPTEFEKTIQRKGQAGDPRFLQGLQWCIERRCKILGIDAPEKQEHSGSISLVYGGNVNPEDL